MDALDYFIPDRDPPTFYPLRSFLRAPPASVVQKYIAALTAPGDLVIDPFAAAPTVACVAQQMERRAIAVEGNPLWSWLTRTMARRPSAPEIDAALTRLGDALKDDTPLRVHLDQLYATMCAACQRLTPADHFVHARGAGPVQRHYTCAHCGAARDDPATEDDRKRAAAFDARGLHYHFAFQRVVPPDNLHAERIRKMLDVYTPRNLYALVTLTIKMDTLFRAPRERDIVFLLLLHLLDRGTAFYADAAPHTPAQLTPHKQFVEFNLWRELEKAARALRDSAPALALADSPTDVLQSDTPRAYVSHGSAKTLAREVPEHTVALVLAAPPTRRLAVWALSYFWGAWILGRPVVQTLVPFLDSKKDAVWERRWYFDSLVASMDALAKLLHTDAYAIFVFNESWHEVIEALLLAAAGAKLELAHFIFQPRLGDFPRREFDGIRGDYRITFTKPEIARRKPIAESELAKKIRAVALEAGRDILTRRGEPLAFSWVHHAAYARAAREGYLAQAMEAKLKITPSRWVYQAVIGGLSEGYAHDLDHYTSLTQFLWLRRVPQERAGSATPLAAPLLDRVDDAVREFVVRASARPVPHEELEDALYRQFPGDLTPEAGLLELCARAYADEREGAWHWRAEDVDVERARALDLLTRLGERLGYAVIADSGWLIADSRWQMSALRYQPSALSHFDLIWQSNGDLAHAFIWRARAQFADVAQIHLAPARGYIVVPETQVALLRAKVQRLPHLADAFREAGWDFVRVPFVEQLLQAETVARNDVALMAGLAPALAGERAQLELFQVN